ncbi:Gustatory receptor PhGr6 [Pediculus humanus corporis]|uniref:Gustatory receptor n=1 Tax=Pediculus humanus subsp. corporis TaxID=121224 RepID=E0VJE2_PEDHC|nr:Gustatory receptor PhGr6 [Pediculus humanus corporis]EEB13498.1 Gustatory receptor PhGr6 [Pediculus humanus corporis]
MVTLFKKYHFIFLQCLGVVNLTPFVQSTCHQFTDIRKSKILVIMLLSNADNVCLSFGICIAYYMAIRKTKKICHFVNKLNYLNDALSKTTLDTTDSQMNSISYLIIIEITLIISILIMSLSTENTIILGYCLWFYFFNSLFFIGFDMLFVILVKNIYFALEKINLTLKTLPKNNFTPLKNLEYINSELYDVSDEVNNCFTKYLLVITSCEFLDLITSRKKIFKMSDPLYIYSTILVSILAHLRIEYCYFMKVKIDDFFTFIFVILHSVGNHAALNIVDDFNDCFGSVLLISAFKEFVVFVCTPFYGVVNPSKFLGVQEYIVCFVERLLQSLDSITFAVNCLGCTLLILLRRKIMLNIIQQLNNFSLKFLPQYRLRELKKLSIGLSIFSFCFSLVFSITDGIVMLKTIKEVSLGIMYYLFLCRGPEGKNYYLNGFKFLIETDGWIKDLTEQCFSTFSLYGVCISAVVLFEIVYITVFYYMTPTALSELLASIVLIFYFLSQFFGIVIVSVLSVQEAEKTANYLHELFIDNDDVDVKEEIEIFSLQLLHRKVEFNACGFFKLDFTLLYSMVGAVTTYIIILMQFQDTEETSTSNAANTTINTSV